MKKILLLLPALFGFGLLTAQNNYSKEVEEQIKQVENNLCGRVRIEGQAPYNISERMAYYKVKGLSVAVVQNYQLVWAKGYGWADEKEKRPVTPQTLFEPGSISKSFNALGVLKLAQDKKLDLNTDINTYLRSWKFPYDSLSKNKKITLMHLLSHSAGLTVHGFPGYDRKAKIPSLIEVLDGKKPANTPAVRSQFEPGLRFQYSGGGTTISQLLVNDITQKPYDKFIEETVFKPLGMDHSFYTQPPSEKNLNQLASAYYEDGTAVPNNFHVYPEQGAAGLWTTPTDICKYIIETQLTYEGKSSKVLNQEMTKLRLTPYNDKSAALGVFMEDRDGAKYFQHGAGNEGFRGIYYGSLESGNGLAIFVNSDNSFIFDELINSISMVYKWKGFKTPITKKTVTVPDSTLQKYVGFYTMARNRFVTILKKEDGYYQYADGTYGKMYFTSPTDYFNMDYPSEKHFVSDVSGKLSGFVRTANGGTLFAVRFDRPDTLTGNEDMFNSAGWHYLETKNYKQAELFLKRGLTLHPKSLLIEGNLAHAYLFQNDYDSAIKIYLAHLNESINHDYKWKDMIKDDFSFFKKNGVDESLMNKVLKELKLN